MLARIAALLRIQPPVVDNRGKLWGSGADYPTLGDDGWQTGAIWCNTTGAAGSSFYVNEGSVTSCNFVPVDTAAGASAGAISFDDDVTGPLIYIETTDPTNDSYTTPFIITGAYSSSADNALVVSSTNTRPVSFLFEDSGDVLGGDIRAGLFRLLLTVDQTAACTINALRAQIKANDLVDITSPNAVVAPLTGYLELDGAGARHLDGHIGCVRAALETGAGAHTVDINLCGFEATLNSSGTFVGGGYTAAFAANISSGTSKWQYGLYLESSAVLTAGIYLGSTAAGILAAGTIPTVLSIQHAGTTASHVIDMIDAYTGKVIETGSYSSSASKGITLASGNNRPVSFLYDDGGADLTGAGVVRGVLSRIMLTVDQSEHTNFAIRGQTKLADLVDVETGIYAPVQGYIEVAGTSISKAGATLSCLSASLDITTALTAAASGEIAGLHVETTGAGTLTATGTVAGILIDKASGAANWPVGLRIDGRSVTTGIEVGDSGDALGVVMSATVTKIVGIYGEVETDPGSAVNVRPLRSRLRVDTGGNTEAETYGLQGQLNAYASTNLGHWHAGVLGTLEGSAATVTVYNPLAGAAGVIGRVGGDITVDGTSFLAGVIALANATVTLTDGEYIGLYVTSTELIGGTDWSYGVYIEDADLGMYVKWASTSVLGTGADPLYGSHTADSGIQACVSVGTAVTESTVSGIGSHVAFLSNVSLEVALEQFSLFGGAVHICTLGVAQSVVDGVACGVTGYIRNIDGGKMETVQQAVRGCIYTHTSQEGVRQTALHGAIIDKGAKTEASALSGLSLTLEAAADSSCTRDAIFVQTDNSTQDWSAVIRMNHNNITTFAFFDSDDTDDFSSDCKPVEVNSLTGIPDTTAKGALKITIDVAGTPTDYYIPFHEKGDITGLS